MAVPRDEELRLALVMNGGVSLAVWIGGVAHEINRFVGETHPVYQSLLELTATRARVDVICGTSAGGVNGAALALCCVYDTTLYSLRDLWLSKGSFADLLRRSGEQDVPSLLDGDGYFLPALQDAFKSLLRDRPRSAGDAPMDVALTSTMLRAEPHSRLDDLGERIHDGHHRALFHFERGDKDPFQQPYDIAKSLAGAARASASFPVAFEPRLFGTDEFRNAHTNRPPKADRYLIDGGVLDNKPLRGALKAIFKMPATTNVRRVLAYIAPDPAVTAAPDPDKADEQPLLSEVALASLLGIPAAQSITDQLQQIDEHNTEVRRQRHTFAWLAANLDAAALEATAAAYFSAYRERRIDGMLDYVLEQVETGLSAAREREQAERDRKRREEVERQVLRKQQPANVDEDAVREKIAFGKRTREWLKALWLQHPAAEQAWLGRIPTRADAWQFDLNAAVPDNWTWGNYALEFVAGVMLDLMRRTQRLTHLLRQTSQNVVTGAPPVPTAAREGQAADAQSLEDIDWDLRDTLERNRRSGAPPVDMAPQAEHLAELWASAYALVAKVQALRQTGSEQVGAAAPELMNELSQLDEAQARNASERIDAITTNIVAWLGRAVAPVGGLIALKQKHALLAAQMADVMLKLSEVTRLFANDEIVAWRPEEITQLDDLRHLHGLLFGGRLDANVLMERVLQLEVGHYSMAGRSQIIDAAVELVQISGRGRSPWGGPATPATKLTGMQLAHFGAFYRKSWRANDWMMGRLDGIDRVIRVALNPDRLHRLYAGMNVQTAAGTLRASEYVYRFIEALAIDSAAPSHRELLRAQWPEPAIRLELSFLDSPGARVPEALSLCASALTRRMHLEVMCKELPMVARCAKDDEAAGAVLGKYGEPLVGRVRWNLTPLRRFAKQIDALRAAWQTPGKFAEALLSTAQPPELLSPQAAVDAYTQCPVGSELLEQEFNSDLMTRTAGQVITVAHSAAIGKHFGVASVGSAMKALTLPVRFFYLLASRLTSESRTSAAVATAILFAGFLFVLGAAFMDKPPAGMALAGWGMLLGWFATTLVRQGGLTAGAALFAFAGLLYLLTRGTANGFGFIFWILILCAMLVWAPAWFTAPVAAVMTMWWTSGHPAWVDVGAALCAGPLDVLQCHFDGVAVRGETFVLGLGPLCVVFVLSVILLLGIRKKR